MRASSEKILIPRVITRSLMYYWGNGSFQGESLFYHRRVYLGRVSRPWGNVQEGAEY